MKLTPTEGMRDYLPGENAVRDRLLERIREVYRANGFRSIETPAAESLENLENSDGGENLKLIYRLEKRGDKLKKAIEAGDFAHLCDLGLRYDLTLPLSRYYAAHRNDLETPFKCIQIGRVYRAERPQKGRLREFVQCDIDILGSESMDCEVELITVTAEALLAVGIDDFRVRVNHRALLRNLIVGCGFAPESADSVCITVDKADKIGFDGVKAELLDKGFAPEAAEKLTALLQGGLTLETLASFGSQAEAQQISALLEQTNALAEGKYEVIFDATLVRGQGYYTGTVFEIECPSFGGTVAGGGRYDNLIGKFSGGIVPAVGFSIGFERIFSVLWERGASSRAESKPREVLFYDEGQIAEAIRYARTLHADFDVTLVQKKKKVGKQLAQAEAQGYRYAEFLETRGERKELTVTKD
ncbi:MAG: histidine--tRNA ligase [Oscillospiraceae bacterium]|nr:histidine--tRNA ligase [Oscillospiraceae bacterium]